MALALVSGQSVEVSAGSGTSWSAAFPGNVTTGNLLVCGGNGYGGTATNFAVSDTNNGTGVWTQRIVSGTQGSIACTMAYCKNATGGVTPTVTFNAGTGASGGTAFVQEWSGADATTPWTAGESGSFAGITEGTHTSSAATNTTNANSVYIGVFFDDDAGNPVTMTLNNAWTKDTEETNGTTRVSGFIGHLIVATSASRSMSVTWTHGPGTAANVLLFAIFQQSAGGGGAARVPPRRPGPALASLLRR